MVDRRGDENDLISFTSDELRREYLVRHAESLLQGRLEEDAEESASLFRNVSPQTECGRPDRPVPTNCK